MRAYVLIATILLAAPVPASEFDDGEGAPRGTASDPGLLDESGRPQPRRTSIKDEDRAGMLDKGRIAEETANRVVGLREGGKSHIPEGLLISKLEEDPDRVQVDPKILRERLITLIDRHSSYSDNVRDRECQPREEEPAAGPESEASPRRSGLRRALLAIVGIGLIAGGALYLSLRRSPR